MDTYTCLEDLSNEIFFELFDYLHALDIFTAFASLNKRISSILQSIALHVIILNNHYDQEINFLSSHLTFHAHQVISLKCYDTIRDRSSIISLLFDRHHFINLQSCIFMLDKPSDQFENVLKQIENLNRLVSFFVIQPDYKKISETDKCDITRTIFMNTLSSLRSVMLRYNYNYNYSNISTYTLNASNLISLDLLISGKVNTVSIYSILPILRVCHRIRYLHAIINELIPSRKTFPVKVQKPFIYEIDLVISSQIKSFHLSISVECSIRSIGYILRCMPNLIHFKFYHEARTVQWENAQDLVNGYKWQNMFEIHVPFLSKFDFHMLIQKYNPKLDLDMIINSFEYFLKKYPEWQMIIDRWKTYGKYPGNACPNVINLKISASYWILSEFINNPFLISIFKKIKVLISIRENRYIPSNFLLKLVERFPSITNIEFEMFSFDDCISAIDILLNYLKDLCYLKIYYSQDSVLDHPFSRNYIIDKRRQAFNINIINQYNVIVSKNRESVEIRL
ncbi:unnamed protein product [Rotaria sp. Silwood1]|nr:unnamed protein product [Rotaria sp. Silwood1]CAF1634719.1 unnamed protein product [Rotaria sp. Silwood1]CAF3895529.1 unnamed protein product [Rotaria sp. Silwood1]CAF4962154.1 unnamed protein product [Rotaria sp. Silwood1]